MSNYIEPQICLSRFTCPYCNTLSGIEWDIKCISNYTKHFMFIAQNIDNEEDKIRISTCAACGKYHLWYKGKMIVPTNSNIQMPNEDMPDSVKDIYMEARDVFPHSKKQLQLC